MDSDIDVVVLTESDDFIEREDWIEEVCGEQALLVRTADWGGVTERRVRLATGFEIEFGFGRPAWADVTPVDPGTEQVIADGCEAWYDPSGILQELIRAVAN